MNITPEMIRDFFALPAPREIPEAIRKKSLSLEPTSFFIMFGIIFGSFGFVGSIVMMVSGIIQTSEDMYFVKYLPLFPAVFLPVVGFGMAYYGLRAKRKVLGLLAEGEFSIGRVSDVCPTNMKINCQRVYEVVVEYPNDDQLMKGSLRLRNSQQIKTAEKKMEENVDVGVLYLPDIPERVMVLDLVVDN